MYNRLVCSVNFTAFVLMTAVVWRLIYSNLFWWLF